MLKKVHAFFLNPLILRASAKIKRTLFLGALFMLKKVHTFFLNPLIPSVSAKKKRALVLA